MLVGDYLAALERLPLGSLDDLAGDRGIVVLAPHPDDESLGCGGLIAAAREAGRDVSVVILTDGSGSHPHSAAYPPERVASLRREETRCAARALGLDPGHLTFLDLEDAAAPRAGEAFNKAVKTIDRIVRAADASALFVTWMHDPHCDHEAAAAMAVAVAARHPGLRLWFYPIWGLHLRPDMVLEAAPPAGFRFDVGPWMAAKRAAIACHASQMTGLIDDDPTGFSFTEATLAPFLRSEERFIGAVP